MADLVFVFKILNGLIDIDPNDILSTYVSETRGPSIKVRMDYCKGNKNLHFFGNRIANSWNNLPSIITNSASVSSFKERILCHYKLNFN